MTPENLLSDLNELGALDDKDGGKPFVVLVSVSYDVSRITGVTVRHATPSYGLQILVDPHSADLIVAPCLTFTSQPTSPTPDWSAFAEQIIDEAIRQSSGYIANIAARGDWDYGSFLQKSQDAGMDPEKISEFFDQRLGLVLSREMGNKVMSDIMAAVEAAGSSLSEPRFASTLELSEQGFTALDKLEAKLAEIEGAL